MKIDYYEKSDSRPRNTAPKQHVEFYKYQEIFKQIHDRNKGATSKNRSYNTFEGNQHCFVLLK